MRYLTVAILALVSLTSCSKEETPASPAEDIQIQVIATGADSTAVKSASNIVLLRVK
jgi:hypothetical protein